MSCYEDVRIEGLAYTGAGVARLATGKTVFVEAAVPGDFARIRIREERERFARGAVEALLEASPERVEPPCPYYARCGGCGLQHLSYREQLRWKRRFVVDALERIGGLGDAEALVADTVASPAEWGYRNKIELEPLWRNNRLSLGLHAGAGFGDEGDGFGGGGADGGALGGGGFGSASADGGALGGGGAAGAEGSRGADSGGGTGIIPIEHCLLLPQGFAELPGRLAGALGFALKASDAAAPLVRVGVRVSVRTGDVELALWTRPGPCNRGFVAKVLGDALKTSSLVRVLVAGDLRKRDVRKVEVLGGRGHWQERLGEFRYRVSAPSFFQVNTAAAQLLVGRALDELEGFDADGGYVADLYSGAGTFTLPLARKSQRVCAIEMAGSSIRDLRRNLAAYELEAQVLSGDVGRALPELGTLGLGTLGYAIVDPPRGGLSTGALRAIADAAPHTLVYVSCDPATLARDVKAFAARGYRPASVTPFDLFPQTWHVETVTKLVR
ncbi:MAG: TRAM domain-containing protein [Coriobacteriales bacterium]|jgi:23S rRNA (uracil1939-C5)-methyltransferase|nr:TRAM domain-containing protein [Coriobacteriales bacterium]